VAAAVVAVAAVVTAVVIATSGDGKRPRVTASATVPTTGLPSTTTSEATATSSTSVPPSTTTTLPPTTAAPTPRFTLDAYRGLGAWVDVFDWTVHYDRTPADPPAVGLAEIDAMAARGVRTLYFQPARFDSPAPGIVEEAQARVLIDRARGHGMQVVGWYLPTMLDPAFDRAQIDAVAALPVDGLGIDIESTLLADEAERNRRVVALSADLRAAYPGEVLAAIVLPPVVTEVYGTYWGSFPWAELAPHYDVWLPMGYWTNRSVASGWRDAYTYTAANIDLLREATGRPGAVVHAVGGIGCCEGPTAPTTPADVTGMVTAARERGAIGASIYDFATTGADLWEPLAAANAL
jgi:hypothetical protein